MIGPDVVVVVLGINGNQVRLGVKAPADVSVDREEVRSRKVQEQFAISAYVDARMKESGSSKPIITVAGRRQSTKHKIVR